MTTERERAHFERVAAALREDEASRARAALPEDAIARMVEGLALGAAAPRDLETEMALDRRALGQAELAMRARRLGLHDG